MNKNNQHEQNTERREKRIHGTSMEIKENKKREINAQRIRLQ